VTGVRTEVELLHVPGQVERWIRFGRVADERIVDRRRRVVVFEPKSVFAFVRWQSGEHGTALSRIDIVRAVSAGESFTTLPFVAPGGELLLHIQGWSKVESVLQAIDAVERLGIDPCEASPDHWRHVNNRLAAGLSPRAYDQKRHRAWRRRREIAP
jgi:hypothetical protein